MIMVLNYKSALTGTSEWMPPRSYASVKSLSYTKDFDFTFSLGRPTNRREIGNLLCQCGAFESYKEVAEKLTHMSVNNNVENGQVLMQCGKDNMAEDIVDKLLAMPHSPVNKRCHSNKA